MLRTCLVLAYACIIHAQISSTPKASTQGPSNEDQPDLRSRPVQDWYPPQYRGETLNSPPANVQSVAKTRQETATFKNVQNVQTPVNSVQTAWGFGKGSVLSLMANSQLNSNYPQSHAASNWQEVRKVMLSNLNAQQKSPAQIYKDNSLTHTQSPWQGSVWEKPNIVKQSTPIQEPNAIDDDNLKKLLLPNNNPALAKSNQPSLATWQDIQGRFTAGLALPSNPKLWKPPSYFQSLSEIEDAMANIKMHFSIDENTPKNDPRYKYIAVVHVIEGLTQEVSQNGWDAYNKNYDNLVLKLMDNISKHPEETMAEVNCVFEASIKKIQRIKQVMTNQWVDYLCKAQSCVCDTLVYAIVKMSGDEELNQEAELLLLLGLAASDYLDIYSRVFAAISKQNVYVYLTNSKEALRTLIYKNWIARRHSSFSAKEQCYAQHSLHKNMS